MTKLSAASGSSAPGPSSQTAASSSTTSSTPTSRNYYRTPAATSDGSAASAARTQLDAKMLPWTGTWSAFTYPSQSYSPAMYQTGTGGTLSTFSYAPIATVPTGGPTEPPVTLKPPSPPPGPPLPKYWEQAFIHFFTQCGLTQALTGFKSDLVVMNSTWEKEEIPRALERMLDSLQTLLEKPMTPTNGESSLDREDSLPKMEFEDRKLGLVNFTSGATPQTHSSLNKSISQFLAQSRAKNVASNRTEFLAWQSDREKKRPRLDNDKNGENGAQAEKMEVDEPKEDDSTSSREPTCARTDAKTVDRDVQMKYDIAKNEDGPLRRTLKKVATEESLPTPVQPEAGPSNLTRKGKQKAVPKVKPTLNEPPPQDTSKSDENPDGISPSLHAGLEERLENIESHLAVRFVPSPPRTFLARLRFLEDHLVRLEKDYPPWAALHFNQPHRGWPPPPRSTPIIVPPSIQRTTPASGTLNNAAGGAGSSRGKNTSSLQRAVMERLEVRQAMNDLAKAGSS